MTSSRQLTGDTLPINNNIPEESDPAEILTVGLLRDLQSRCVVVLSSRHWETHANSLSTARFLFISKESEGNNSLLTHLGLEQQEGFAIFFSLSAEPAAVMASRVESDISKLPTLMIRDASERAACVVIYRANQTEETPRWWLQTVSGDFAHVTTWYLHSEGSAAAAWMCADRAFRSYQAVEKMMLHLVS